MDLADKSSQELQNMRRNLKPDLNPIDRAINGIISAILKKMEEYKADLKKLLEMV